MSDEVTLGEVSRQLVALQVSLEEHRRDVRQRLHDMSDKMTAIIGPISALKERVQRVEEDLDKIETKVDVVTTRAAQLSGGIGILVFVASLVPWPWKQNP